MFEMEIKSFDEAIGIINFMLRTNFQYNPYTSYMILEQKPNAALLKSVFEWSLWGCHIDEKAVPITVPLPITKSVIKVEGKDTDVLKTPLEVRQKILLGEIKPVNSINYSDFELFDVFDTDFPKEDIAGLLQSFDIAFETVDIVPILKQIAKNYNIKIKEKNLSLLGIDSFYSVEKNQIFMEKVTPQALLAAFISFVFEKTTTKPQAVQSFEKLLATYIFCYVLSINLSSKLKNELKQCYDACLCDLDFFESVTRVLRVCFFIKENMNKEYAQIEKQKETEPAGATEQKISIFNNIKEN